MDLWFNKLELVHLDSEVAVITTPSDAFVDLLNTRYGDQIAAIFEEMLDFYVEVRIFPSKNFDLEAAVRSVTENADEKKKEGGRGYSLCADGMERDAFIYHRAPIKLEISRMLKSAEKLSTACGKAC